MKERRKKIHTKHMYFCRNYLVGKKTGHMRHILSWVDIENHTHSNSPIHIGSLEGANKEFQGFGASGEPLFVGIEVKKCTSKSNFT